MKINNTTNTEKLPKNVAVIGLGSAGLGAVKELKEAGISVTGFDPLSKIGGRWANDPNNNCAGGIYQELHLNTTRRATEYSDFPWDREDYIGRDDVKEDYLKAFPHYTGKLPKKRKARK
jgi:cation diffusion facilitator CzcD-associated flavoprotein CzcO